VIAHLNVAVLAFLATHTTFNVWTPTAPPHLALLLL
jgi:hypothetical protein